MYTNRKMVNNELAAERDKYFCDIAYEYTFRAESVKAMFQAYEPVLSSLISRGTDFVYDPNDGGLIVRSMLWRIETTVKEQSEGFVRLYFVFTKWRMYPMLGKPLFDWEEINPILTSFEKHLCLLDPYAWLREMPTKRTHKTDSRGNAQDWTITSFDSRLTLEQTAEKGLYEGYLADRLESMGVSVYGGSKAPAVAPHVMNPLIAKRIADNEEYARTKAEQKAAREQERILENERRALEGRVSLEDEEKKKAEEKAEFERKYPSLTEFPFLFLVSSGEDLHPYIHAEITEDKTLVPEPEDGMIRTYRMTGIRISYKENITGPEKILINEQANKDYLLYVTDSRIAVINGKYNKDRSAGWIGLGSPMAQAMANGITLVERGIRAGLRHEKALAGHIRYEWIRDIGYYHKVKMLENEILRVTYVDRSRKFWQVDFYLNVKDIDAETLANEMVVKLVRIRNAMTDEKNPEDQALISGVLSGQIGIQRNPKPHRLSMFTYQTFYYATKGAQFRNMKYLERYESVHREKEQKLQQQAVEAETAAPEVKSPIPAEAPAMQSPTFIIAPEKQQTTPSQAPAMQQPVRQLFCTGCGTRLPEGARFCPNCGTPVL